MARKWDNLETPVKARGSFFSRLSISQEGIGRVSEGFARAMGTGGFLLGMTLFVTVWLSWNTLSPESLQFDPRALNFTLLTLILSLQASYAAPLILLAQNRQDDRDRVKFEQDRQRAERNLNDTEYLAREVAALRLAIEDIATKDFVQDEMQQLLKQIDSRLDTGKNDGKNPKGSK